MKVVDSAGLRLHHLGEKWRWHLRALATPLGHWGTGQAFDGLKGIFKDAQPQPIFEQSHFSSPSVTPPSPADDTKCS